MAWKTLRVVVEMAVNSNSYNTRHLARDVEDAVSREAPFIGVPNHAKGKVKVKQFSRVAQGLAAKSRRK